MRLATAVTVLAAPGAALAQGAPAAQRAPLAWVWLAIGIVLLVVLAWLLFTYAPDDDAEGERPRRGRERGR